MAMISTIMASLLGLGNAQISYVSQSIDVSTSQPSPTAILPVSVMPQLPSINDVGLYTNETIGELVDVLEQENIAENSTVVDSYHGRIPVASTDYLSARSASSSLSPIQKFNSRRIISAVYNSTENGYYNITMPGCIAADDIIGDIEAPNGTLITNASFGDLITTLQLPGSRLHNYTLTMMEKTLGELNATLEKIVCDGPQGAARTLLWPPSLRPDWRNGATSDGFITTFLIGGGGVVAIAWGGTRLAIAKAWPTENITMDTEVGLLAATSLVQYLFITGLFRLQASEGRWIGKAEAAVLNGLIWVGAQLIKFLDFVSGSTCIQTDTARTGVRNMMSTLREQAVVVGNNAARGATIVHSWSVTSLSNLIPQGQQSSSAQNLPDLEAGVIDPGHMGQEVNIIGVGISDLTEIVVDSIEHQLSGTTQPGAVCQ